MPFLGIGAGYAFQLVTKNMKMLIHDHVKKQGVAFYTQLVGVVQSIAAGYLIVSLANYKPEQLSSTEWILYGLQFLANFQLIVLVWHVHLQHVTIFSFIFGLPDSYIPFIIAIIEFFLVVLSGPSTKSGVLPEIRLWFCALFVFMLLAVVAYKNMFDSVQDEEENLQTFETIRSFVKWIKIYIFGVSVSCAVIAIWNPKGEFWKLACAIFIKIMIGFYTWLHNKFLWKRLLRI